MPTRKAFSRRVLLIISVVGLLMIVHWLKLLTPVEYVLTKSVGSIAGIFYQNANQLNQSYGEFTNKTDLLKALKDKEEENHRLMMQIAQLNDLKQQNDQLRKFFNYFQSSPQPRLLAQVIFRDLVSKDAYLNSRVVINRGLSDGVRTGLVAIDESGLVVGKVTDAKQHTAEISLLANQDCQLAVSIQSASSTIGIARGDAGLTVKINYIPQTISIEMGSLVVTSGLEDQVPGSLVLGRVSRVDKENNELWQTATIEPLSQSDNLVTLAIILPNQ